MQQGRNKQGRNKQEGTKNPDLSRIESLTRVTLSLLWSQKFRLTAETGSVEHCYRYNAIRGGARVVPGGHSPPNFAWPPQWLSQNFPGDVMSLHWSPTQTIDSSPCCKTGPSSGPPKWKCLAPPLNAIENFSSSETLHKKLWVKQYAPIGLGRQIYSFTRNCESCRRKTQFCEVKIISITREFS